MHYFLLLIIGMIHAVAGWAGTDRVSEYTNTNSIINTRHNFTLRSATGADLLAGAPNAGGALKMGDNLTNYTQVCVYCHTPHGANTSAAAPLWNRVIPTTTYTTYNQLNTAVGQTYAQPGGASLACLSCHDGQQAMDAIINMPGSGMYSATPNTAFLETYRTLTGQGPGLHSGFATDPLGDSCNACHVPGGAASNATDFTVAVMGTDLRNDHPVGVTYPTSTGGSTDWKTPDGNKSIGGQAMKFFDETPNGRLDKTEIRLYPATNGPSVECATCHDPHGVPSAGAGSSFIPTFLRKSIAGSDLCLTCHAK